MNLFLPWLNVRLLLLLFMIRSCVQAAVRACSVQAQRRFHSFRGTCSCCIVCVRCSDYMSLLFAASTTV